jgi:hypothetical protein
MCGLGLLLALAAVGPAPAQSEPATTELEPILVTPKVNPLEESMERLRRMMEDPACEGCGPLIQADPENIYLKIGKAVSFLTGAGLEPPNPDFNHRLEYRLLNDWRAAERGPNWDY